MVRKHGDRGRHGETAARVLEVLRICAENDGTVSMAQIDIAEKLDMGRTAVQASIQWLVANNLLEVVYKARPGVAAMYLVVGMVKPDKVTKTREEWRREALRGKVYSRTLDMQMGLRPSTFRSKKELAKAS